MLPDNSPFDPGGRASVARSPKLDPFVKCRVHSYGPFVLPFFLTTRAIGSESKVCHARPEALGLGRGAPADVGLVKVSQAPIA